MQMVNIDLENCYGIRSLQAKFDFTKKKANIIYAPNGSMKTSLAQTFKDLSDGKETADRIYKTRLTKRVITDESGTELPKEQVFVIEPYVSAYESSRISTLLVNKELKEEYDKILFAIDEKKESLLKELKKFSGVKNDVEGIVSQVFVKERDKFLIALGRIEKEVLEEERSELSGISYNQIFNDKVEEFLKTKDFKDRLEEYTKIYDRLLSSSTFFKKGVFNHYQAGVIAKNLKDHGFFKAEHSLYLNPKTNKKQITTESELEEIIKQEKEAILTSPELKNLFKEIDDKLKTVDLRAFREYLLNNQNILPELSNLELFQQKLWKSYLIEQKVLYKSLMDEYNNGKSRIQAITELATQQATQWQEVINIFNKRFSVPFKVIIENKQDVILKRVTPNIKFQFTEEDSAPVPVDRSDLIKVLSNGENRALYILNIIFEVQARRTSNLKTLFVIDDIADSFDYKNKYAIVEYLNDMLTQGDFYQIILTHNYDFYRTVSGRLELGGAKFQTVKTKNYIKFEEDKIYKEPFEKWKKNTNKIEMLVAMIPFVRNLSGYCGHSEEEQKLTSLLHIKSDTDSITVADLQGIIQKVLNDTSIVLKNPSMLVKQMIYDEASKICNDTVVSIELEKKIALSIAIRLKTEEFLISKINDPTFVQGLKKNQTAKLIKEYKTKFSDVHSEKDRIEIVERVNLMTPENIHLNSFMYEPILDMSNDHLKALYQEVSSLMNFSGQV